MEVIKSHQSVVPSGEKGAPGEIKTSPGDPGQKGEKGLSGNPGPEGETDPFTPDLCVVLLFDFDFLLLQMITQKACSSQCVFTC